MSAFDSGRQSRRKGGLAWRIFLWAAVSLFACAGILSLWLVPIFRGYGRSLAVEEILDQRYSGPATFTPPLDGRIPRERMEAFLRVRRTLAPMGGSLGEYRERMARMERHAQSQEARPMPVLRDAGRALTSFVPMTQALSAYVRTRDEALLTNAMGLGEYTWLYVVCYVGGLGERPARIFPGESRPDLFETRVYPQVREMIRRRVERGGPDIEMWRRELAILDTASARIPFQDGLPEGLRSSIEPYREQLVYLSCPAAAEPDLVRTRRRRLGYDHD